MNKTQAGFLLVGSLIVAVVCISITMSVANAKIPPSQDALYGILQFVFAMASVACIGGFFYGAMIFSRKGQ
jgi:hypothetical protein